MGTIAKVTAGGATHLIASTAYATCPTGASTAAKVATIQDSQDFTLIDGITVHVYFTYSNTAANPTLNVNSTGAKAIYKFGNTAAGTTEVDSWPAGSVVSFTYNKNGASDGCWTINNFQKQTAQVNSDWTATTGTSSILNKPAIPAAQVNSNWTATTGVASILNKPSIPSTYSDVGAASAAHVHGSITSDGKITATGVALANGDALVITDSSDSNKIKKSSITFGTSATSFLANNGTWVTPSVGESYTATAPISISGTDIQHVNSGVTSGTYGLTVGKTAGYYYVPSFTVDSTGHITNVQATASNFFVSSASYNLRTSTYTFYSLPSSATSTSVTVTDPGNGSTVFTITGVKAIDAVTYEPLVVDWSVSGTMTASITLTVSVASNYSHAIRFWPVVQYTTM